MLERQNINLPAHTIYPMGLHCRLFVVPRLAYGAAVPGATWTLKHLASADDVRVHFVPFVKHHDDFTVPAQLGTADAPRNAMPAFADVAAAEAMATAGAGPLPELVTKDAMPHGELHKAYLCLSQRWLGVTAPLDAFAVEQAFRKVRDEAHIEADELVRNMRAEFRGYTLRRSTDGMGTPKVSRRAMRRRPGAWGLGTAAGSEGPAHSLTSTAALPRPPRSTPAPRPTLQRGMLLWGPPGTGKSQLSAMMDSYAGFERVGPGMAAGQLTAKFKGTCWCARAAAGVCCWLL